MDRSRRITGLLRLALLLPVLGSAQAAILAVKVTGNGEPLAEVVVSAHSPQAAELVRPQPSSIDQRHTQFQPHILLVHVGSLVTFPNSDNVRHQVYSFSPAKRFELPLYAGKPAAPVLFDRPGVVELGCNIHDWMLGYVIVLDTPYHAMTSADGAARIELPAGHYSLELWSERLPAGKPPQRFEIDVPAAGLGRSVDLAVGPPVQMLMPQDDKLRALQEKFRKLDPHGGHGH